MKEKTTDITYSNRIIQEYKTDESDTRNFGKLTDDEKIDFVAERILKNYRRAFEALAK